jgi:hypothetical protein
MISKILASTAMAFSLLAVPAFAGASQSASQQAIPNTLVIKVQLDKTGRQMTQGAQAMPLTIQFNQRADGTIDSEKLVADSMAQLAAPVQTLQLDRAYDETQVPNEVRQVFNQADQKGSAVSVERRGGGRGLSWRSWNRWGGGPYSGYYGYGYYPAYGYYPNYANYNPNYYYYDNNVSYPYNYHTYYPYNGYGYYYYLRR